MGKFCAFNASFSVIYNLCQMGKHFYIERFYSFGPTAFGNDNYWYFASVTNAQSKTLNLEQRAKRSSCCFNWHENKNKRVGRKGEK